MDTEYRSMTGDDKTAFFAFVDTQDLNMTDILTPIIQPRPTLEEEVDKMLTEDPRWRAVMLAVRDGQIIGLVYYLVESSSFLGGNSYRLLIIHVDSSAEEQTQLEIDRQLRERSRQDSDW